MNINYREYNENDIPEIRNILEHDLGYNVPLQELSERIKKMKSRGNYKIFVACDNENVIGFVGAVSFLAFEISKEALKIIALAVSEPYRKNGIGTELLHTVEQYATDNDIGTILLNSGLPRENAHKFYESQGYHKNSYGFVKQI